MDLFRQSLFTQLLEANIAPTRLTMQTLDASFEPSLVNNKIAWPDRYWKLLDVFGSYLFDTHLDDVEIDSFEEDAVPLITFHQTKGLEFDHVYVAAMGREPDVTSALRTQVFSGNAVAYQVQDGHPVTADAHTLQLGEADRDRENYVALTRAKARLTILVDPTDGRMFMGGSAAVLDIFNGVPGTPHPNVAAVTVKDWSNA
jgi:DNA helicase-2/ATP-dependent DNA helicase PcrA